MEELNIDKIKTALVIIDLQKGIASMQRQTQPYAADVVVGNASKLVEAFHKNGMPVFPVRVTPSADFKDSLQPITDNPPMRFERTTDWADLVPDLGIQPTDLVITKRQWGAFYGTELDLQLRRRGITTIALCGISTNIGVESTARAAYELGYQQIFAEDAMAASSLEEHENTIKTVFSRIGRVRKTGDILAEL
ncbi:hydrolase [Patescibacteria group bacterium]|nr:hydrolase [Patescibacteria group bacterium]